MPSAWSPPIRTPLPLILIRGFGGLTVGDERKIAYQGFNEGSVYHHKRGENYIYEGFILRMMKSRWRYEDATNVVNFYSRPIDAPPRAEATADLDLPATFFSGDRVVVDPDMARIFVGRRAEDGLREVSDVQRMLGLRTMWVFRYYDLDHTEFSDYGAALRRLIDIVRALTRLRTGIDTKVNIIAHSMGGLIARQAIQEAYGSAAEVDAAINKVVTLGTPHRGISFQLLRELGWLGLRASDELWQFNSANQANPKNPAGVGKLKDRFPLDRLLCVAGTDFRSFSVRVSSFANRLFSVPGEDGLAYNRSDGLVKQINATVEGAPRTFVHKCHGGGDSLMTARESFEVASRFFFGDTRVRLRLVDAEVTRRFDVFGRDEIFFGVSIKPRRVDFDLFHQSKDAENCYGPFRSKDLSDPDPTFPWAGPGRLIWDGWLDSGQRGGSPDLVLRADIYVGERDMLGVGFSDNIVFRKQVYVRALLDADETQPLRLELHTNENFQGDAGASGEGVPMERVDGGWEFTVTGDDFRARFRIELEILPENAPSEARGAAAVLASLAPEGRRGLEATAP